MIGSLIPVTVTEIGSNTLFGALVQKRHAPVLAAAGA
jgi:hypothetical protein